MDPSLRRQLGVWLFACCLMTFATVVVGGITRLTHAGLSIVEWQPLVGTLPPRSDADWQELFAKYQQTPEYRKVNLGMTMARFQYIFWWEYAHRLLGRTIGLVFALPLAAFALRHRLPGVLWRRLIGMFVLGGLQGALGWYMVKSGLVDDPRVSHYRLTAHLGLAFILFAWMFSTALALLQPRRTTAQLPPAERPRARAALGLVGLIFVMVLSGGLVAGLRAGLVYNTFPTMDGNWWPPTLLIARPLWRNFLDNPATVQFDHRLLAWLLALLVPWLVTWVYAKPALPGARRAALGLLAAFALQVVLGIVTLLHVVPVPLAAAHQAGAVLLFAAALVLVHELHRQQASTGH